MENERGHSSGESCLAASVPSEPADEAWRARSKTGPADPAFPESAGYLSGSQSVRKDHHCHSTVVIVWGEGENGLIWGHWQPRGMAKVNKLISATWVIKSIQPNQISEKTHLGSLQGRIKQGSVACGQWAGVEGGDSSESWVGEIKL